MTKPITWFEIPAADLDRACRFYETLFGVKLLRHDMGPSRLAIFPYDREKSTGGCLAAEEGLKSSADGVVIYLNAGESFDAVYNRIPDLGGCVVSPRTELPDIGLVAHFIDSEGNRVGLHGPK